MSGASSVVRCTVEDLDRILDVLIENAIDYGPPGQRITLHGSPGRLEVIDQGPGLAPGEEETIFARFHRGTVGRASRRKGTGLGLPIARELASRWHGTVTLANGASGGATATIVLPMADGTTPERSRCRVREGAAMTGWRRNVAIAVAAVAGLLVAAALTTAASSLSGQSVGLSSEPLTAGRNLAPAADGTVRRPRDAHPTAPRRPARRRRGRSAPARRARPRCPTRTAVPTAGRRDDDDNSGHGGGDDDNAARRRRRQQRRAADAVAAGGAAATTDVRLCQSFPLACRSLGWPEPMVCGMNLRTPLFASLAVVSALGGVAAAAIALPSGSAPEPTAAAVPSATPTPEVRTKTIRRTIHVVRRDKAADGAAPRRARPDRHGRRVASRLAPSPSPHRVARRLRPPRRRDDSGHHSGGDDSGHHSGGDDSGHHGGGDDDSGHGRGRGRGRGGDDD